MVSLTGYTLYRKDRIASRGGGVCVYIADHLFFTFRVNSIATVTPVIETLFLELSDKTTTFLLGCVYRPSSSPIQNDKILTDLISNLSESHDKVLVFGDFSMPDIPWLIDPSRGYKPSSQFLVDLLTNSHLNQLVTQPTRYRGNQNPSTLDLIICSDDHSLTNLEYLPPIGKSDHLILTVDLQICQLPRKRTVLGIRTVTDYEAINQNLLGTDWTSLLSNPSVVNNWNIFKDTLQYVVGCHTKFVTVKQSHKKPWIIAKLLSQINRKRALWRAYKRSGSNVVYRIHRAFSNKLSSDIREARCVYEKNIAEAKDAKRLYKYIRTKLSGPVATPQLKNPSGEILDNNEHVADMFATTFSSVFTVEPPGYLPKVSGPPNPISCGEIIFTPNLVCEKLKQLKGSKSPGPDLITAKILHMCADTLCEALHTYDQIF
ncbi:hypothetical protein Zmor_017676 [Zophobas morio]|uniref:Endonuclease/exonuclease/phosphatase domain-containing protein n=1 Tax=Zophobas morio TaxID=2755281 RepID=A0AA38MD33_9CUCU|nr:hypothetical protein Zmor_017676 [Zophobas morio]